ncbi:MAG: hypothetical protein NTX29_00815 [Actinobacteria bacterium]|nr:hypothetical protein [Actinomycetota bacterium]
MDRDLEDALRRVIGGDISARADVLKRAGQEQDPTLLAMAAVLSGDREWLAKAEGQAASTRDRQIVAIASAHVAGDSDLVDALARDHLADYPDSLIVAWLAGG